MRRSVSRELVRPGAQGSCRRLVTRHTLSGRHQHPRLPRGTRAFGTSHTARTVEAQRATRRHSEAGRRNGGHVRPYQTLHRAQGALRMTLHVGAPHPSPDQPPSPARQPRLLARPQPRVRAGPSVRRALPVLLYPAILPKLSLPCLKTYSCNGSTLA